MLRRFRAHISRDKGITWTKTRAVGWAIRDIKGEDEKTGYVVALDIGDILVDVEVPLRVLKLLVKDAGKVEPNESANKQRPTA